MLSLLGRASTTARFFLRRSLVERVLPVIILNSSPAKWDGFPLPADAMLILSGLALA
jgi:hypothetical protein